MSAARDRLSELAEDFFASWQNPPPNSVHAVTEFIDYVRGVSSLRAPQSGPPDFIGVNQTHDGCWFACIASLTGIPLGDFPEPPTPARESEVRNAVTKLLHAHGWQMHRIWTYPGAVPQGWAIAGGTSPRNLMHAVVVYDGELVWDPHPSRAGLVTVEEYEIVVSVRPGNVLPVRAGSGAETPPQPEIPK